MACVILMVVEEGKVKWLIRDGHYGESWRTRGEGDPRLLRNGGYRGSESIVIDACEGAM